MPSDDKSAELLGALRAALQYAAVETYRYDYDPASIAKLVATVQERHTEASGNDIDGDLERHSWQMQRDMRRFCQECLQYPVVKPFIRGLDGVQECRRCRVCAKREVNTDLMDSMAEHGWWMMCDVCMDNAREATRRRTPFDGITRLWIELAKGWCEHRGDPGDEYFVTEPAEEADAAFDVTELCRPCIVREAGRRESFRHAKQDG